MQTSKSAFASDFKLKKSQKSENTSDENNPSIVDKAEADNTVDSSIFFKTPFATDDRNSIMQFQSNNLICSSLHFHESSCDRKFNEYSEFQPFGMLYAQWNDDDSLKSEYIETSDLDLADTFEPQSKEESLTRIYNHIVSVKEREDATAHLSQHILKQKFADVYKEYFLAIPSKSPPLQYTSENENENENNIQANDESDIDSDDEDAFELTEEHVLQQIFSIIEDHFSQYTVSDPYNKLESN